jgi:hypothetical protein
MTQKAPDWLNAPKLITKHVSAFCANGYTDNDLNHCAHFVSHALGLSYGYTCKNQVGGGGFGASIRVHELFGSCDQVGSWSDLPANLASCLIFITNAANVTLNSKTMINHPRKHVGVYTGKKVYHYSNTGDKVVEQTVGQFNKHYPSPHNSLFYGKLPTFV